MYLKVLKNIIEITKTIADDTDSMIVQQTFTFNKKGKLTKSSKLNIIPCSISSSSGYNDYCPVPLTGDAKQRVLDKISQYSEGL